MIIILWCTSFAGKYSRFFGHVLLEVHVGVPNGSNKSLTFMSKWVAGGSHKSAVTRLFVISMVKNTNRFLFAEFCWLLLNFAEFYWIITRKLHLFLDFAELCRTLQTLAEICWTLLTQQVSADIKNFAELKLKIFTDIYLFTWPSRVPWWKCLLVM